METLVGTRDFEGCESINMYQNQDDPTAFVLVEQWTSPENYDRYVQWRSETGSLKELFAQLSERGIVRKFIPVGI